MPQTRGMPSMESSASLAFVATSAASGAAHPHQSMSCATRLKCVASLVRTRSRQAAPGFVVERLLLAAGSARVLAAGAGSRRLRVLGLRAIFLLYVLGYIDAFPMVSYPVVPKY